MACVFATLLLHDDGQEVSEENVKKVLAAAGLTVQPYWPALFLKAIGGRSIDSLLTTGSGSAPAPAPAAGGQAAAKVDAPAAKVEEKVEEAESIGGLFD